MWSFIWQACGVVMLVLVFLSLRGKRWAYWAFVGMSLLYFPARVGFRLDPHPCSFAFTIPLAIYSLRNYAHIALFAFFYILTSVHLRASRWRGLLLAGLITLAMGVIVELGEAISGQGTCRLRDLVPDAVGALLGAAVVSGW